MGTNVRQTSPAILAARKEVGAKLREIRERRGLTTSDVANIVGIDRATVSKLEAANWSPTLDQVLKIAAAVGVRLEIVDNERI